MPAPSVSPTPLSIRLFGAPEVRVAGEPLRLTNQKARALLYYLAATRRPHTRDHLTSLLWSESPPRQARHSLRTCLYRLRRSLRHGGADGALVRAGELLTLELGDEGGACDVHRFRRLAADDSDEALAEAVSLYRGPLLEGFTLADAPGFDEWARMEEADLARACREALDRLAHRAEARGALDEAADYLERLIALDPLLEEAHRRLIALYVRRDAAPRALLQYRRLEAALRQELGVAPSPETQALLEEALRRRPVASPTPAPTLRPPALPFVGRQGVLGRLRSLADRAAAGRGLAVLLQGQAGIGKSRLLAELTERLAEAESPWLVLQGACSPFDDPLSYGPFLEMLDAVGLAEGRNLADGAGFDPPEARGRFFWRTFQTLRTLAASQPVLLVIDDLQWADSATLNLFGFLALRLRDLRLMLVGTVQRAEAIPALQRLVTLGRRRGGLHLLPVEPLTGEAVADLLSGLGLEASPAGLLGEWLHERSGGSPFILAEILAQLRAEAILSPNEAGLSLDAAHWLRWRATFSLPETTYDLVAWRLANLTAEARRLLEVLAVAGHPLMAGVLDEVARLEPGALAASADDLAARGLLAERPDGTFALPHHLVRETLLHRLSQRRRRAYHRALAAALEAAPGGQAEQARRQIAVHAVTGEDEARARRYGLQALDDLARSYRAAEALEFVTHLHDLLGSSASAAERLRLLDTLGDLHQSLGQLEAAAHWRRQQIDTAVQAGAPAEQAAAYYAMGELALVSHDYRSAVEATEAGLAASSALGEPALAGRGRRLLGAALAMEGSDLPAAEAHLHRAADELRQADLPGDLCSALFELGNVAAQRGQLERALGYYEQAGRAAEAGGVHYYHALAWNNSAYHNLLLGRPEAARAALEAGLKLADAHDLLGAWLHLFSTQGELHLYLAEWQAAADSFRRGLTLAEELGSLERQAGYRGGLALAARGSGDTAAALDLLHEALALLEGQGYWHLRARLQVTVAETLADAGQLDEAGAPLAEALETARAHGRALLALQAERVQARLLADSGDWPAADELFARLVAQAQEIGIPLEVARVQSAWAAALLRCDPGRPELPRLLEEARATFRAANALADFV